MLPRYNSLPGSEQRQPPRNKGTWKYSLFPEHDQKKVSTKTIFTDDSDDEKISIPPKLSNFGSALLSEKEKENINENDLFEMLPKDSVKPSSLNNEPYYNSVNHTPGNTYASIHSGDPSQSTLFAQYRSHQQPSMTTMNSTDVQDKDGNDFENSFQKIKSMQQSMREELTSRHAERRSRRFLNSSRKEFLGPAKRASAIFPEALDRRFSGTTNSNGTNDNNNSTDGLLQLNREESPEEKLSLSSQVDLGDLNPVQYLKKHDLPTSELPRISRLYFEKQKPRKMELARLKQEILRESRTSSSGNNGSGVQHIPIRRENSLSAATQPRRKLSDTSSRNIFQRGFSSPVARSVDSQRNILSDKSSLKHNEYDSYPHSNTLLYSHRKREALANIDVNRNNNDQIYEPELKRYKYFDEHHNNNRNNDYEPESKRYDLFEDHRNGNNNKDEKPISLERLPSEAPPVAIPIHPSVIQENEFHHREAPKPPVVKKVEIVEPEKRTDSKGKSSNGEALTRRNATTVNDVEYEKIELLGRGGSSKVYKVKDNNNKLYALKRVVFDEFDDSSVNGFKGEIELLNKLKDKTRVVKLFDYEMEHGVLYLIMECGDHDLSQILNQRAGMPLDIEFVRYHAREMLKCVKVVHDAGIVHSDLKPANFVFVKGILKIIDFGIANAVPDHTVNIYRETQIGTPNYMAPEALVAMNYTGQNDGDKYKQQNRWKVGKPSDVWSCGCIIYQMIYGRPPYGGFQGQNRLLAIMNPEVKIIFSEKTANDEAVPRSILDTMKACLLRNPDKRLTVDEVLDSPFLKPVMVTPFFIRDLIKNAVRYGADQKEVSKEKVEELADDVLGKLADIRL
ncbi:hypothetical protein ZYGR_0H00390 [Zygosaccharomyces rouxii]|uniref:ZYRO0B04906p n=2 Tax=Zygosaccharomyces rouxii TaxID=4956 RepID=C5DR20_ZYGRC|nr:uncharacterized protein ZYRO0B04906g [Zygosaccharomyces rouxii]KAH9200223.1 kinase-like domain-containing protein [Zygosaccharomyces rouxii]GAV47198.1 hypothetical protein ZYGR_0H00390 [Zygosaccharomyces rouxii]CAR26231.1 ZYRO0B04906p [Zygosaccharomyces rouxii]